MEFANIYYSEDDCKYINELYEYFEKESRRIIDFFEFDGMENKIDIIIWNDIAKFRQYFLENNTMYRDIEDVPKWICAYSIDDKSINILSLNKYIETEHHERCTFEDMKLTLVHEFVHFCHHKLNKINMIWINEGLATNLSRQIEYKYVDKEKVNVPLSKYNDYCFGFKYVLDNYDKQYLLKLISDFEFQKAETPRLWEEIEKYYDG